MMSNGSLEKFGDFIHRLRRSHRWSQNQLGEKLGVRSWYITGLENAEIWPSDYVIDGIAQNFGVPHEFLFAMLGPRPAQDDGRKSI